jgi:hypothetical protein
MIEVISTTYGKGSNPGGGRGVRLLDGTFVAERLVCHDGGIPEDGGQNPEFDALVAGLNFNRILNPEDAYWLAEQIADWPRCREHAAAVLPRALGPGFGHLFSTCAALGCRV